MTTLLLWLLSARFVKEWQDVRVFESPYLGQGYNSAGLALPGIGIIVGIGAASSNLNSYLLCHEYGHILQAEITGKIRFYLFIGTYSLMSAATAGFGKGHQSFWVEKWANYLAARHFDMEWPQEHFPAENLDDSKRKWLLLF